MLAIKASGTDVNKPLSYEGYKDVARKIMERYGCKAVAITLRSSISANDNKWAGMLCDGKDCYFSKEYDIRIWDRVGGGDSFGAGLIFTPCAAVIPRSRRSVRHCGKAHQHTIQGDFNRVTLDEVKSLMNSKQPGPRPEITENVTELEQADRQGPVACSVYENLRKSMQWRKSGYEKRRKRKDAGGK